jgi:hypothetical protein
MKNVPIVVFGYNRPRLFKQVMESILKAVEKQKIYIILDGSKGDMDKKQVDQVLEIAKNITYLNHELVSSKKNLGLTNRIISGLNYVFSKEPNAIILEDDTLPSNGFIYFCSELLDRFKDDKRIYHISGCNNFPSFNKTDYSYFFSMFHEIWGWATWADRWKNFQLYPENTNDFENDLVKEYFKKIPRTMRYWNFSLKNFNYSSTPDTWDFSWRYSCLKHGGLSVIPTQNMISNIGIGPDATHTTSQTTQGPHAPRYSFTEFSHQNKIRLDYNYDKKVAKRKYPTPLETTVSRNYSKVKRLIDKVLN